MISHFDVLPYSDDKTMKMLSIQWKYHDPAGAYWTTVNECFTLMTVGNVPRTLSSHVDQAAPSANRQRCINRSHDAGTVVDVDRTAPAIYDELHNCVGWPPSDSSTIVDSTYTWRSNAHERNKHSYLFEARVLESTPSLKTVDSLFYTGESESPKCGTTILRSPRTTNSREQAAPKQPRSQKCVLC